MAPPAGAGHGGQQQPSFGSPFGEAGVNHRAALAPLLPFHLLPDQHFANALQLSMQPLPTEGLPILDDDLRFAASFSSLPGVDLRRLRERSMGILSEMKRRWSTITAHLRGKQTEAIRTATLQRDVGFTAILLLLANWGDVTLPAGLCMGLPAVGYAPWHFSRTSRHPSDTG